MNLLSVVLYKWNHKTCDFKKNITRMWQQRRKTKRARSQFKDQVSLWLEVMSSKRQMPSSSTWQNVAVTHMSLSVTLAPGVSSQQQQQQQLQQLSKHFLRYFLFKHQRWKDAEERDWHFKS